MSQDCLNLLKNFIILSKLAKKYQEFLNLLKNVIRLSKPALTANVCCYKG